MNRFSCLRYVRQSLWLRQKEKAKEINEWGANCADLLAFSCYPYFCTIDVQDEVLRRSRIWSPAALWNATKAFTSRYFIENSLILFPCSQCYWSAFFLAVWHNLVAQMILDSCPTDWRLFYEILQDKLHGVIICQITTSEACIISLFKSIYNYK